MRHYNPVLHGSRNAWADQERRFKGGGGGSSGPTQTNVQNTNIPEYARPYVETMLGTAQQQVYKMDGDTVTGFRPYQPYSSNAADYIAPFSPLQKTSFTEAANLQTPSQFGAGSTMVGAGGLGALGAGQQYNQMATNPYATQAYMNPYIQTSLQPQLQEIARQYGITGAQQQGQATAAGAFGGSREALMAAENQRNKNIAMNQAIGQGYDKAFQAAQQAQQFGANLGLQGYGQAVQAGAALGQLGTAERAAQEANINLRNQMGLQQQTQQQNIINQAIQNYATAQQYPMQQLASMSALLRGLPLQATTTETYQAQPTALNTLAGLGTGIAGLAKMAKKGGVMKSYSGGGITSLANRQRLAEKLSPKQLDIVVANKTIPQEMGNELRQDSANMQERMAQAAALTAQRQEEQQAQAAAMQAAAGIDQAPTNLASETATMAQGGIVAFAGGDLVSGKAKDTSVFDYQPTMLDTGYARDILTAAYNPATGKPWTRDEIAARNRAQETAAGIKDIYGAQLEDLAAEKAKLASKKDQAMGMALLGASGEIFRNASLPGFGGIGAGLSKFSLDYGSALDKIDANEVALRKEGNQIQQAQMAMKQAQLKGDTDAYNAAENEWKTALTNANVLNNENIKLKNQVGLEGAKAEYDRGTKYGAEEIAGKYKVAAAKAGNTTAPYALDTHLATAISNKASFLKDAIAKINTNYGESVNQAKLNPDLPTNKKILANYKADIAAVYNQASAFDEPIIGFYRAKGKDDTWIANELKKLNQQIESGDIGSSSAAPNVIEYNADGTRKK